MLHRNQCQALLQRIKPEKLASKGRFKFLLADVIGPAFWIELPCCLVLVYKGGFRIERLANNLPKVNAWPAYALGVYSSKYLHVKGTRFLKATSRIAGIKEQLARLRFGYR
jgi:hypothetical protein